MASKAGQIKPCTLRIPGPSQGIIDQPGECRPGGPWQGPGISSGPAADITGVCQGGADGCTWRADHDFHPSSPAQLDETTPFIPIISACGTNSQIAHCFRQVLGLVREELFYFTSETKFVNTCSFTIHFKKSTEVFVTYFVGDTLLNPRELVC